MKVLAGLEVTAKSVERTAGGDWRRHRRMASSAKIVKAVQLDLRNVIIGKPISILYVQMDGTGVPVVKKETEEAQGGKTEEPKMQAYTRAK